MYTQEQIEKKRQDALRKQQEKMNISNGTETKPPVASVSNQNFWFNANNNKNNNYQAKSQSLFKQNIKTQRFNPTPPKKFYGQQDAKCEVNCTMITNNRFAAEMSKYNEKLIELFKTIPSRLYDPSTRMWNFHINDYEALHDKLTTLKSELIINKIPSFTLKIFKNLSSQQKEPKEMVDFSQIDSQLVKSLYPFQKSGIEFGILKNGKCLIADDMGLGKTRQALGIAHYFKKDWPLIIVTPSSVRYQWYEAIVENLPSVLVQSIQNINSTKDYIEKCDVTIISYDLLNKRIDEISAKHFGVVICDESHYLKSNKTQRTKAVQQLVEYSQRVILLTGTPALSRPIELYSQIRLVLPSFMNITDFGLRYCAGVKNKFGWDFTGSSNSKELDILLKACCLIRRLKSEVMKELPSKIRQKIILDPNLIKASTKEVEKAASEFKAQNSSVQNRTVLLPYYSASSKAKEQAVCNYIADLVESDRKFLVFAHHGSMLDAISNLLSSKKISHIRIDGKTNPEQRKILVDKFQENMHIMVAVLSITAANAGLNLTSAQMVVFAELYWNPGILAQAEDRIHRIGQTDNVVIYYLLAKNTVDDFLWPAIQKKIDVLNNVGLDQNFDLDNADVQNQVSTINDQTLIEDFFTPPDEQNFTNTKLTDSASSCCDKFKNLLDADDDAFLNIDLDEFDN